MSCLQREAAVATVQVASTCNAAIFLMCASRRHRDVAAGIAAGAGAHLRGAGPGGAAACLVLAHTPHTRDTRSRRHLHRLHCRCCRVDPVYCALASRSWIEELRDVQSSRAQPRMQIEETFLNTIQRNTFEHNSGSQPCTLALHRNPGATGGHQCIGAAGVHWHPVCVLHGVSRRAPGVSLSDTLSNTYNFFSRPCPAQERSSAVLEAKIHTIACCAWPVSVTSRITSTSRRMALCCAAAVL